jgi:hypothetical protein
MSAAMRRAARPGGSVDGLAMRPLGVIVRSSGGPAQPERAPFTRRDKLAARRLARVMLL